MWGVVIDCLGLAALVPVLAVEKIWEYASNETVSMLGLNIGEKGVLNGMVARFGSREVKWRR